MDETAEPLLKTSLVWFDDSNEIVEKPYPCMFLKSQVTQWMDTYSLEINSTSCQSYTFDNSQVNNDQRYETLPQDYYVTQYDIQ